MALPSFLSSLVSKAKGLVNEEAKKVPALIKTAATQAGGVPSAALKYIAERGYEFVGQPIARNIAGSALDVAGGITGNVSPTTLTSQAKIQTAGSPLLTKVFGKEPVISTSQRGLETQQAGRQVGGSLGELAAIPGLAVFMGLESAITPGSPAKKALQKGATKIVAKTTAKKAASTVAKAKGFVDEAARAISPTVKGAKEVAETAAPKLTKAKSLVDDLAIRVAPAAQEVAEELPKTPINVQRLNIPKEVQKKVIDAAESIKPELEKVTGRKLTNAEVVEAAKTSDMLRRGVSRELTLKEEAAILKTRQHLAALAEGKEITPELIDTLQTLKSVAADRGRQLQSLSIGADPSLNTVRIKMLQKIAEVVDDTDAIVKAAQGVDFSNAKEAAKFYRTFVPPKFTEVLDEFRYMNMLSSPKTHIVNAFSNLIQSGVVRPATRLAAGIVDNIGARLTGKQREFYVRQVPAYYKGMYNSVGDAAKKALDVLQGKQFVTNLDLSRIPTGSRATAWGQIITNGLEAGDVFFRSLVEGAEQAALAAGGKTGAAAVKEASETAAYTVFRKALDTKNLTGQGSVLTAIDKMTDGIQSFGKKVPAVRWFVPFVQTPMNILKQGVEYSPLGFSTLKGSTHKTEQIAKALVGSFVFAGAGALAAQGRTTWALPENKEEREAFYAAGLQPYSVRIGDSWIKYDKLGPLAYPMAMAAATQWYLNENPKAATQNNTERLTAVLGGVAEFFSDQSYMQGLGNLIGTVQSIGQGGKGTTNLAGQASTLAGQLVPLASLQRWVARMIDPVFRKPGKEFNVESIVQNLKRDIPFVSKTVEPYLTPRGEESKRPMPFLNALTPFTVSTQVPEYIQKLRGVRSEARLRATFTKQSDALKEELVDAVRRDEPDISAIMEKIAAYNADVARLVFEGVEAGDPAFTDPVEARKFVTRYQLGKAELQTAIKKGVALP